MDHSNVGYFWINAHSNLSPQLRCTFVTHTRATLNRVITKVKILPKIHLQRLKYPGSGLLHTSCVDKQDCN